MSCTVCKGNTGLFYKKCSNGLICRNCLNKIPSSCHLKNHDNGVAKHLCSIFDSKNKDMCRQFIETYRIGRFHFDGNHLLAAIGKISKDGHINSGNKEVFSLSNVRNLSFVMENVHVVSEKKVTCDIVFICDFYDTFWTIREVISKNETCFVKQEDDVVTYSLPVGVQIVWDDIIRSVNTKREALSYTISEELPTDFDVQCFKAKMMFLLEPEFQKEDVLNTYEKLAAVFASDTEKMVKIEDAKATLLDYLEFVKYDQL